MVSILDCDQDRLKAVKSASYAAFTLLRLVLMLVLENLFCVTTFILYLGTFYYPSKWRHHSALTSLVSQSLSSSGSNNKVAAPVKSASDKVTILTQNLWVHYFAPSPNKDIRLQAFVLFLNQLKSESKLYDILILQEIFAIRCGPFVRCTHLTFLVSELSKLGYTYYTDPSGVLPYFGQNGGVVIFSLHPLHANSIKVETFNQRDELMLCKGYAIATARIALDHGRTFDICLGSSHCSPYRTDTILSQIGQFRDEVGKLINQERNVDRNEVSRMDAVIGGDFNTSNQRRKRGLIEMFGKIGIECLWERMKKKGQKDAQVTYRKPYLNTKDVFKCFFCFDLIRLPSLQEVKKYKKGQCIDHILTNIEDGRIESVTVVDTRYHDVFVSDHLGVLLEVQVPSK